MTEPNVSDLSPAVIMQKLNACYEQLAQLVGSNGENHGEAIYQMVIEAEQWISRLTEAVKKEKTALKRAELLKINQQVATLIESIQKQRANSQTQLIKVKKGQNALKGYRPIRMGMGFNEGKFIDSKK